MLHVLLVRHVGQTILAVCTARGNHPQDLGVATLRGPLEGVLRAALVEHLCALRRRLGVN